MELDGYYFLCISTICDIAFRVHPHSQAFPIPIHPMKVSIPVSHDILSL